MDNIQQFSGKKTADEKKQLASYTLLHFINDLHATTLPNVLPIIKQALSLSLAQLGILNAAFGVMHFLGQPVSGYLADRQTRPWFAVWGPLLSIISIFMLPSAPHFAVAVLLCTTLGLGTALFHPQGNGMTGKIAMGRDMAFYLSLFTASGSFASAFGPILFVFWYSMLGKKLLPLMTFPYAVILLIMWRILSPYKIDTSRAASANTAQFFKEIKNVIGKIFDVFAIVTLRDIVFQGTKVFLPMLVIMRGGSHTSAAAVTFSVVISVAFANIIGGRLASVFSEKKLLLTTLALAPFAGITGIYLKNFYGVAMLMLFFGLLEASAPVTISMAQRRCPESMSTAASIASGTSWGVANLAAYPVGALADKIGLESTMYAVALIPWLITLWYAAGKFIRKGNP